MKARVVGDIRDAAMVPGAIEFDAFKRQIYYTCPCGCGTVAKIANCWLSRDPLSVYNIGIGLDGKPCPTGPMLIGILNDDGKTHWCGKLIDGEWVTEELESWAAS